jgi:hypothetical protein
MDMLRRRATKIRSRPEPRPSEWRRNRLLQAGFPAALAEAVSRDDRFDLHALLELLDRGCEPELAVRIIAPLDEEGARRW